MTKFRKSLLIFGILVLLVCTALGTFIVLSLTGSLKDERIALEFTVGNLTREYNGKPQKASSDDKDCENLVKMDEGYLIEGHEFSNVTFTGEQTDVGWCPIGLNLKVVDKNGYDVTDQYKIKVNEGILFVTQTDASISVNVKSVPYDGTEIDIGNDYDAPKITDNGHRVLLRIGDKWFAENGKNVAGKTLNATDLDVLIVDANGRNVSNNYNTVLACRVNILERQLTIAPKDVQKPYDGLPLECSGSDGKILTGTLASGHYIAYRFETEDGMPAKQTDVGSLEVIAKAIVYDIDGDDVTDNYLIGSGYGTMTVTKADLKVNLKPIEKQYGKPFTETSEDLCTIVSTINTLRIVFKDDNYLTDNFSERAIGTAPYTIGLDDFEVFNGDENVTDKFNISVNSSNLKTIPREVKLVQDDSSELTAVYQDDFTFTNGISLEGISDKHSLVSFTCEPVSAGEAQTTKVVSLSLVDEYGNNAREYYSITNLSDFTVTVNVDKKAIIVYFPDDFEYETQNSEINGITLINYIKCDELDAGNFTILNNTYFQGVNEVTFDWKPTDENKEYRDNYKIEAGNRKFTLIRTFTASIQADEDDFKVYDGQPISEDDLTLEKLGVAVNNAESYTFGYSNLSDATECDEYEAEIVFNKGDYERLTVTGVYKILPFKVTIQVEISTMYNGLPYEPLVSELTVDGGLNDAKYYVQSYVGKYANDQAPFEARTHRMVFDTVVLVSDKGEIVNPNIQVDLENSYALIDVSARNLSISLGTLTGDVGTLSSYSTQDITSIVSVLNLADGDVVKFEGENGDGVGVIEVTPYVESILDLNSVKIYRGQLDVTNNYVKPNSVTGVVVTTR